MHQRRRRCGDVTSGRHTGDDVDADHIAQAESWEFSGVPLGGGLIGRLWVWRPEPVAEELAVSFRPHLAAARADVVDAGRGDSWPRRAGDSFVGVTAAPPTVRRGNRGATEAGIVRRGNRGAAETGDRSSG